MAYASNTLEHHWMPFTHNREFKENPRLMLRAEGVHYWNHEGDKLLDAMSGLFCCAAGHARREIADAVAAQLMEVDYCPAFQTGTPPSFELARRVAALTPDGMDRIFFTNSGSESVETALKIAMAYHRARGEGGRLRFVSRERAYHGVNLGGTALGGLMKNREAFGAVMPGVVHMRHTWNPDERFVRGQPETGAHLADDLQHHVDVLGASNIAACIVEPIAGSTGVLVPPKGYLERLRAICDAHGILLIFDEVICGFGRTGKAFAAQSFNVTPDIITMAKALTNGAQPMGAVAVSNEIYETIVTDSKEGGVELFHGYTYSAHPAACAAALATLDIYENEGLFERAANMSEAFLDAVFSLQDEALITDIRGYGMLAGFDLKPSPKGPGVRGMDLVKRLYRTGVHMKVTGDSGFITPPLIIEMEQVNEIISILRDALHETN